MITVSLLTEAPKFEEIKNLIWSKELFEIETKEMQGIVWYKNYRIQSVFIIVLTAVIVISKRRLAFHV